MREGKECKKKEKLEKERIEKDRLKNERVENERIESQRRENERLEKERLESLRLGFEYLDTERQDIEAECSQGPRVCIPNDAVSEHINLLYFNKCNIVDDVEKSCAESKHLVSTTPENVEAKEEHRRELFNNLLQQLSDEISRAEKDEVKKYIKNEAWVEITGINKRPYKSFDVGEVDCIRPRVEYLVEQMIEVRTEVERFRNEFKGETESSIKR
jgi:hypothetical protein